MRFIVDEFILTALCLCAFVVLYGIATACFRKHAGTSCTCCARAERVVNVESCDFPACPNTRWCPEINGAWLDRRDVHSTRP